MDVRLKADRDSDAIKETMDRQPRCHQYPKLLNMRSASMGMFMRLMHSGVAFKGKKGEKTDRGKGHHRSPTLKIKEFRDNIE